MNDVLFSGCHLLPWTTWACMFLYHLMFISCLCNIFSKSMKVFFRPVWWADFNLFLFLSTLDDISHNFIIWRKMRKEKKGLEAYEQKYVISVSLSVKLMLCCAAILWTVWNSSSCCALIHVRTIKPVMSKDWLYSLHFATECAISKKIINLGVFTSGSAGVAVLWSSFCPLADSWSALEQGSETPVTPERGRPRLFWAALRSDCVQLYLKVTITSKLHI